MLQDSLQDWLKSSCGCDLQMINFLPTCYDGSTIVINMSMRIDQYNAVSMYSLIAKQVNQSDSLVFNIQSGLAICLSPDCKGKYNDNEMNSTSTTTEESDDENSLLLIIAPTVGVLCGIILLLVIVLTFFWVIYKRYI